MTPNVVNMFSFRIKKIKSCPLSRKNNVHNKVDLYRLVYVGKRGFCDSALSKEVNTVIV